MPGVQQQELMRRRMPGGSEELRHSECPGCQQAQPLCTQATLGGSAAGHLGRHGVRRARWPDALRARGEHWLITLCWHAAAGQPLVLQHAPPADEAWLASPCFCAWPLPASFAPQTPPHPQGWFHEVSSFSTPGSPVHMALNYWVHPPDNLDPSPAGFAQPYRCGAVSGAA